MLLWYIILLKEILFCLWKNYKFAHIHENNYYKIDHKGDNPVIEMTFYYIKYLKNYNNRDYSIVVLDFFNIKRAKDIKFNFKH